MDKKRLDMNKRRTETQCRVMAWLNSDSTRSQAQLAKATDMNTATLSTFLSGKCQPRTDRRAIESLDAFFRLERPPCEILEPRI